MSAPTEKQTRNPLHTADCEACGAPVFEGRTAFGEIVQLDIKAPVFGLVGAGMRGGMEVVKTELALVDHRHVCAYRDA